MSKLCLSLITHLCHKYVDVYISVPVVDYHVLNTGQKSESETITASET
jgi:hypothetical protein